MDLAVNCQPLHQKNDSDDSEAEQSSSETQQCDDILPDDASPSSKTSDRLIKYGNPRDGYNVAFFIFYLLGMTTLLPWNFFITPDHYWMYKLREVSDNSTVPSNGRTPLQAEFTSYLSLAANVPNTVFMILGALYGKRIPLKLRMIGSLALILVLFLVTTSLVYVNTDTWQQSFFILTLATVVILNVGTAIMNLGLYGIVGSFPHRYITAVVGGQALGGVFAALANIVSIWLGASPQSSALAYFLVADIVLATSVIAYLALSSSPFFKFYMGLRHQNVPFSPTDDGDSNVLPSDISFRRIQKKIWVHCFSILMVFVVTIGAFPGITVLINSVHKANKKPWNYIYFVPVVGFLIFSICDYAGRLFAGWLRRPKRNQWLLALLSILRIAFIPLFMFCNAEPRNSLPVLIDSDAYYVLIMMAFALSNGYLANIIFINVPSLTSNAEVETASQIITAWLSMGTSIGAGLSLLMIRLL
ncbi:equilibrative nucleoside transporter 3 [Neocloeon triangulifer]|uniref:equilibrative nucleoside transporter 3 n=1 Tax=Neocloeon triangulifer TaxID=2078957 RepID=UPI00286F7C1F|nr:equilibrative nucleoside transporter 3 [Neocloeon triangulifer]